MKYNELNEQAQSRARQEVRYSIQYMTWLNACANADLEIHLCELLKEDFASGWELDDFDYDAETNHTRLSVRRYDDYIYASCTDGDNEKVSLDINDIRPSMLEDVHKLATAVSNLCYDLCWRGDEDNFDEAQLDDYDFDEDGYIEEPAW